MLLAYLLDKNLRGGPFYQSVYYMPVVLSLAVVGFIWKSVMYSPSQGLLYTIWPGGPIDFVGDQTMASRSTCRCSTSRLRGLAELRRHPDRPWRGGTSATSWSSTSPA